MARSERRAARREQVRGSLPAAVLSTDAFESFPSADEAFRRPSRVATLCKLIATPFVFVTSAAVQGAAAAPTLLSITAQLPNDGADQPTRATLPASTSLFEVLRQGTKVFEPQMVYRSESIWSIASTATAGGGGARGAETGLGISYGGGVSRSQSIKEGFEQTASGTMSPRPFMRSTNGTSAIFSSYSLSATTARPPQPELCLSPRSMASSSLPFAWSDSMDIGSGAKLSRRDSAASSRFPSTSHPRTGSFYRVRSRSFPVLPIHRSEKGRPPFPPQPRKRTPLKWALLALEASPDLQVDSLLPSEAADAITSLQRSNSGLFIMPPPKRPSRSRRGWVPVTKSLPPALTRQTHHRVHSSSFHPNPARRQPPPHSHHHQNLHVVGSGPLSRGLARSKSRRALREGAAAAGFGGGWAHRVPSSGHGSLARRKTTRR